MIDLTHATLAECYIAERRATGDLAHCPYCGGEATAERLLAEGIITEPDMNNPEWTAHCILCNHPESDLHWLWACNAEIGFTDANNVKLPPSAATGSKVDEDAPTVSGGA